MKTLIFGLAMSLGIVASDAKAQLKVEIDGKEYMVSNLIENCTNITGDPAAQAACFNALSMLLEQQSDGQPESTASVAESLEALRDVAQFDTGESGLSIAGLDCNIHVIYYSNYFHISRRNVSSIDLYSAQFDVSKLQFDQIEQVQVGQLPMTRGVMDDGVTAAMRGGSALESTQHNFAAKSARASISDYAIEVAAQLPANENQEFNFVLVHPENSDASGDIWAAFETFATACNS